MTKRSMTSVIAAGLALVLAAAIDAPAQAHDLTAAALATATPSSLQVTAPETIAKGTAAYVYVKVGKDVDVTARLQSSPDGSQWKDTGKTMPIVDGYGVVTWKPSQTLTYRIVGKGIESSAWTTHVTTESGYAVTTGVRSATVHTGESVFVTGYAARNGINGAYRIRVEHRTASGDWKLVAYVTAKTSGWWGLSVRPSSDMYYRAKVVTAAGDVLATSDEAFLDYTSGTTTLEERRSVMGWRLGAATTGIRAIPASAVKAAKYTGGATSARYQKFKSGMLIEVTETDGDKRTWFLEARHLSKYASLGYWNGTIGLPERDAKCQLLEGGCVTLFSGGAIYTNHSKMSTGRYVAYGRYAQVETVAAALSQRGYEEPSWRKSKYNTWIGGTNAWCQVFVAWATTASGHAGDAPVKDYFPTYVATMKKSPALIRDPKASQIRAGDILIFDWGTGTPTHTGFAVRVSGNYVYTIEGNTTDGTSDPQRGVYYRKRPISGVWGMYHPNEYKAATS